MSIKFAALILTITFSIISCTNSTRQNIDSSSQNKGDTFSNQQPRSTDTVKGERSVETLKSGPDSTKKLTFSKDVKSLRVKGRLRKPGDIVTYYLRVTENARLTGRITADGSSSNIRFNQIVMPDGQSDGPFGQQIEYPLTQKGVYKIKIGQNLMAENAFVGDFLLDLTVQ